MSRTDEAREIFVWAALKLIPDLSADYVVQKFDAWLREVRDQAWDEGYARGSEDEARWNQADVL